MNSYGPALASFSDSRLVWSQEGLDKSSAPTKIREPQIGRLRGGICRGMIPRGLTYFRFINQRLKEMGWNMDQHHMHCMDEG